MIEGTTVLVRGIGEIASTVARRLLLAGCRTALHQPGRPRAMRRRSSFADAWFSGVAELQGVEARRCDDRVEFLRALRGRGFVPLLGLPLDEVVGKWPWDVLIDARRDGWRLDRTFGPEAQSHLAALTIGLGPGFVAGEHVDIAIDTTGPDPGAIRRPGGEPGPRDDFGPSAIATAHGPSVVAIAEGPGIFHAALPLGAAVAAGDALGWIGAAPVPSPAAGRLRGALRDGTMVEAGEEVCDIAPDSPPSIARVAAAHAGIARAVELLIETERGGGPPIALGGYGFG